jgi:arginyl-tRNA--protein-N-Asp/Glu arginylyltransferase
MFAEVHCPRKLLPEELDQYLERGWFRMGQTIFTTNFLNFKNHFYSAIWLRIPLANFTTDSTEQKLQKKNARFRVEIQPAFITAEKEALFSAYKKNISFEASSSLSTLLYGKADFNVYNTTEINIYDQHKLIATGFFDIGKVSAAGISSFYDPVYKKYSLGKYLIYLKIEYCKKINLQYFYPGYFVPGYTLFDYKLEIGKPVLQYLEFPSLNWKPLASFRKNSTPLHIMRDKLHVLQALLLQSGIESRILTYEFFDANLIPELEGIVLFDFPVFLICDGLSEESPIVFDVRDQQYHWIKCKSVWASASSNGSKDIYSSHVFKFDHGMFSSEKPQAIMSMIINELKSSGRMFSVRTNVERQPNSLS